jgi:hypothetical protein
VRAGEPARTGGAEKYATCRIINEEGRLPDTRHAVTHPKE